MKEARWMVGSFEPVIALHPNEAADVRRLLLSSPAFREICEDYLLVREMIADLETQAAPGIEKARSEYFQLASDLELDIARALRRKRTAPAR